MMDMLISKQNKWFIIIVALSIIKLMLVGNNNIIALNAPHDDFWYIQTAFDKVWAGDEYNNMSFIHLQLYAVWLKGISLFNIPTRLAIEFSWLTACLYLSYSFVRLGVNKWLAILLFAFLCFHPYSIGFFDRSLAETLLAVVMTLVLAGAIELWNTHRADGALRRRFALVSYVLGFAIAYHLRKEGIVMLVPLVALVAIIVVWNAQVLVGSSRRRLLTVLVLAPVLSTIVVGAALAGANYAKWGVYARYELAASGYKKLMSALNKIDVGRTPHQVTVTQSMLELAYKESDTFRELKPHMEGPAGNMWYSISNHYTGITEGIGNGWFYWALRDVAASAGWHKSAEKAQQKYLQAATELDTALADGRLPRRELAISSFIDPDYGKWLPELPQSVSKITQLVIDPQPRYLDLPRDNASESQLDQVVQITGPRKQPSGVLRVSGVKGWINMPEGTQVGLGDSNKTYVWHTLAAPQRPDVKGAYGFELSINDANYPSELHVVSIDNHVVRVPLSELKEMKASRFEGAFNGIIGVDRLEYSQETYVSMILDGIFPIYQWLSYVLCVAVLAVYLLAFTRKPMSLLYITILTLLLVTLASRIAVFSILDASSWNGVQARYMFPYISVFACMGVLGLYQVVEAFKTGTVKQLDKEL